MSALYFDTSYLGKLRWPEPGTPAVAACAAGVDELACSLLGRAEFYSLSHRKVRESVASAAAMVAVCAQFEADCAAGALRLLPLTEAIVEHVTHVYCRTPAGTFLRAADALHLATAAQYGFAEIYSSDRHLLAAAPLFGLRGMNVVP